MERFYQCIFLFLFLLHFSGKMAAGQTPGAVPCQNVRIMFYNVENLYDPYDDTTKLDDEFTSAGAKHWTYSRFREKINHLGKTILAAGEGDPPAIVGLCEVENRYVLNKLVYDSPVKNFRYRIIHHDSPDARGVDAAMLYRPDLFRPLCIRTEEVRFADDTAARTREILYVRGLMLGKDTVHLFVNHWPSRRGGEEESAPRRMVAARIVKQMTDSLFRINPQSAIIIMGDLNDEPSSESITKGLSARGDTTGMKENELVDLMFPRMKNWLEGTIRYRGRWSIFDQFIVSGGLLKGNGRITTSFADARIVTTPFLVEEDSRFLGNKLKRTYSGPRYLGGFSDHLPVILVLHFR
jgi:hypothetical protein